jgi:hypothetical protein
VDLPGDGFVGLEAWGNEDQIRALAAGGDRGHGGADAEFAGLVTGGGDDSALAAAADGDGAAAEVGVITLLDGRVEGVHVDVNDTAQVGSLRRVWGVYRTVGRGRRRGYRWLIVWGRWRVLYKIVMIASRLDAQATTSSCTISWYFVLSSWGEWKQAIAVRVLARAMVP